MSEQRRRYVLAGLLGVVGLLAAYLLREVLPTVFFAIPSPTSSTRSGSS